jgi:DNA-binding transcriptional ArsR family regulator
MLRIHFAATDLARTTVASSADVLWEILLSLHTLQERVDESPFDGWRRAVGARIPGSLRPLFELAPPHGYSVDFITPTQGVDDLSAAIEVVLATPPDRVTRDLAELSAARSPFYEAYAKGETAAVLRQVTSALTEFFGIAIAPYWTRICHDIDADRARQINTLGNHGVERLLESLHPRARWRHPVLEIDDYADQDLCLGGRGLVLVPSYFCRRHPMTLKDPGRDPTLIVPVGRRSGLEAESGEKNGRPLVGLLGRTRAAVLRATVDGCSTTGVAHSADISPAAVSHHTKVLREAGLITTERDGYGVCHRITELGVHLLSPIPGAVREG